jgi:hypothetical protein
MKKCFLSTHHPSCMVALGTDLCDEANLMVHCSLATSWFSLFCVMQQVVVGNCHKCRNYVMMIKSVWLGHMVQAQQVGHGSEKIGHHNECFRQTLHPSTLYYPVKNWSHGMTMRCSVKSEEGVQVKKCFDYWLPKPKMKKYYTTH